MHGMNDNFIKAVEKLKKAGYEKKRCNGSHFIFSNGKHSVSINKDLNRMVAKRILKECGITEV